MEGKTSTGFAWHIDESVMDNMELVDTLAETTNENDPIAVSRITLLLLGKETRKRLYDHLRKEDGRVPVAAVSAAVTDIFKEFGAKGKN